MVVKEIIKGNGGDGKTEFANGGDFGINPPEPVIVEHDGTAACGQSDENQKNPIDGRGFGHLIEPARDQHEDKH